MIVWTGTASGSLPRTKSVRVRSTRRSSAGNGLARSQRTAYRCECARSDCNRPIELTPAEYEQVRARPRRFLVLPGHERPEVETVIQATLGYLVVAKRDEAGAIAEATDPRE